MGTLFRILTLILCLELIVSPINPSLGFLTQNAYAESCPAGHQYDSILNRCLTKDETTRVMNATMNCNGDVECYKQNAQQAFQEKVNAGEAPERKGDSALGKLGQIAGVAGAVTYAILGLSKTTSSCGSSSFWGMVAGGAAAFIGDQMANMQHSKRLKQIKEDWGKIVNPEQANGDKDKEREISIEAQSQAFEMMARAEDSLEKAAKMKKNFFTVAMAAYGVTAALAAYEIIQSASTMGISEAMFNCPATTDYNPHKKKDSLYAYYTNPTHHSIKEELQLIYNLKNSSDIESLIVNTDALHGKSTSLDDYENLKKYFHSGFIEDKTSFETFKEVVAVVATNLNPFSNAFAAEVNTNAAKAYKEDSGKGFDFGTLLIGGAAGLGLALAASAEIKTKMMTPGGRLIFSGVMALMTGQMASHAGQQADAAKKRAELLRKMRDEFISASGAVYACKSEDREDPAKPTCYCYTAENQRNPNRSDSKICRELWAGVNTKATDYGSSSTAGSTKVCITSSGQPDAACQCKKNNSCMKVNLSGLKGINAGTMSLLSSGLQPVNKIADGSIDGATIDTATLANNAAKIDKLNSQLMNHPALKKIKATKDKNQKQLMSSLSKGGSRLNNTLGSTGSRYLIPTNPGEAIRTLEKELVNGVTPNGVSNDNILAAPTGGNAEPELEFGLTPDELAVQEAQIAELMKEELDYGNDTDMSSDAKANIFDLVSNRYQRSGFKRLFSEDADKTAQKTQPEK